MLGPDTGLVGAGAASAGDSVYYTLAVKRLTGAFIYRQLKSQNSSGNTGGASQPNTVPQQAVSGDITTSTPNPDGSITHKVQYGETLVEIANAYNIPLKDLISINRLDPNHPVYFAGQVLIIRLAFTATPFVTTTYTPRPPTRTPQPTRTPRPTRTEAPPSTPFPTPTATREPLVKLPTLDDLGPARPVMAYAFIGISAIGLVVLILTSFWPGKKGG
jgi:LysM repeat protein